jgi:hypothetical protein
MWIDSFQMRVNKKIVLKILNDYAYMFSLNVLIDEPFSDHLQTLSARKLCVRLSMSRQKM